jgi:hypothetical protein
MYAETFYVLVQSLTEKNIILVRKDKKECLMRKYFFWSTEN